MKLSKSYAVWAGRLLFLLVMMMVSSSMYGQTSREYIRNAIRGWGECRNVAITRTNGDLALYGRNGWAQQGCPSSLVRAIRELRNDSEYIDDIQLTESGRWVILFGNNGCQWSNIPYSLEKKLRQFNNDEEVITAITLNDSGDWAVITQNYISASSDAIQEWLHEGTKTHGALWTACITDDGMVAVYENGYRFYGNVPDDLRRALRNTDMDVYRLKISGTAWFYADQNGRYNYNM